MAPSRSIPRRLGEAGPRRCALLMQAVAWLLLARLVLLFVPFPKLARRLGTFVPPTDRRVSAAAAAAPDRAELAREIGWAVTRAARHVPFEAVCLPQAMAARIMLARRGIRSVLHFGAAKGPTKALNAHAWLSAAGVEVTGYPVAKDFAEIACFV
jgi:hypothetical protein